MGRDHRASAPLLPIPGPLAYAPAMMARSHVVIGACAWIFGAPLFHAPPLDAADLAAAVAGALLPDIDHPRSWVGRRTRPLSGAIAALLGHRGLTHSALAVVALVALLARAGVHGAWATALAVGYASHLAADLLTPQGLRLAWPAPAIVRLPLCRAGSTREHLIVLAIAGGTGWWWLRHGGP